MTDDEPLQRRSVHDFCARYNITRNEYIRLRQQLSVKPFQLHVPISPEDQRKMLREHSRHKRIDNLLRDAAPRTSRPSFRRETPPPRRPLKDDPEARAKEEERLIESALKWRSVLHEVARPHVDATANGRCPICKTTAPCVIRRKLTELAGELVEEIARWDPGTALARPTISAPTPDSRLRQIRSLQWRAMQQLADLSVDHILVESGKCGICKTQAPCHIKRTVERANRGIARRIAELATMSDAAYDAALHRPRVNHRWDDWDGYGDWEGHGDYGSQPTA